MGLQISPGFYKQVPNEEALWRAASGVGRAISQTLSPEGLSDRGRAHDGRPCAYPDVDPAEVLRRAYRRVLEGQDGSLCRQQVCPQTQVPWLSFLGTRLLRIHHRLQRTGR